ncbi:MAG: molybdenum cofactor biosynthesis protein MoaE [Chloroflexi bacterium]|nr:molybdenum cofactor biosynthesis protein MoaE [Chloroflexota bacterium]
MRVHVKFFAIFREMTGIKTERKEIADNLTVEQLWNEYRAAHARLGNIRAAYAVNQKLVKPDHVLRDGDEVGFLPPVSGGAKKLDRENARKVRKSRKTLINKDAIITRKRLDLGALVKRVEHPGAGAIITFSGVVRDNAHGKMVKHLEYEAYPEMAESSMREIIAEMRERWSDVRVALAHRVGKLKIGEASLIIVVSAPHRPEAYAASRYAIERVKAILPVWKKEFALDGDHWVEGPIAGEIPTEQAEKIASETGEYLPF